MARSASTKKAASKQEARSSDVALQWICFGLWEWALIALSALLSATLSYYFVDSDSDYALTSYMLAATVCLLPFALIAERMYAKREPEQKHGFAGVVMVLNAVLVFLATVAALITAVMSTLSIFVSIHSSASTYVTIISSVVVTTLGMMLFARIINPPQLRRFTKFFPAIMLVIAFATLAAAALGPLRAQINSRGDRFIEDNLSTLNSAIQRYAYSNGKLPATLNDVVFDSSYEEGAKTLAERNLVNYKANTKKPKSGDSYKTFYYRLCVTFKESRGNGSAKSIRDPYALRDEHGSGRQCYDQEAYDSSTSPDPKA